MAGAAKSAIGAVQSATGLSWFGSVMSLLLLAFVLYILMTGSASKYKAYLFG